MILWVETRNDEWEGELDRALGRVPRVYLTYQRPDGRAGWPGMTYSTGNPVEALFPSTEHL